MTVAESRRKNLWFGTREFMQWIPTPNRGASTGGEGWQAGGTTLNGGGYQFNSFGSHRNYIFEWPNSSAKEASALMSAYADGTYGRGLIYFIDPLIYDQNVFPMQWANPSVAINNDGFSHVYGVTPQPVATPNWKPNLFPVQSAKYVLDDISPGWRGEHEAVFLPIPVSHTLTVGASYTGTNVNLAFRLVNSDGELFGPATTLPPVNTNASNLASYSFAADQFAPEDGLITGIFVFVQKPASGSGEITIHGLMAKISKGGMGAVTVPMSGPWVKGQGHSGCRFIGKPTEIKYSGVNGGQVGYAASFREVGDWITG